MMNFTELLQGFRPDRPIRVAVVQPTDAATLKALFHPAVRPFVVPFLIGDPDLIKTALEELGEQAAIYPASDEEEAAAIGVAMIRSGEADCLMKGHIQTRTFLKAIVAKETGIVGTGFLSHAALNELPDYHKPLLTMDGGMILRPTKEQKIGMVRLGVDLLHKLGVQQPKVGLLAAAETVNLKVIASVEAKEICQELSQEEDFLIEGPISLDLALSRKIAEIKHYDSPVAGDADLLIGPDIATMNVLGKSLTVLAKGKMAGLILGAAVPIIMTSRGSDDEEKLHSLLLALYCSGEE